LQLHQNQQTPITGAVTNNLKNFQVSRLGDEAPCAKTSTNYRISHGDLRSFRVLIPQISRIFLWGSQSSMPKLLSLLLITQKASQELVSSNQNCLSGALNLPCM
jgi:hypothetical protein